MSSASHTSLLAMRLGASVLGIASALCNAQAIVKDQFRISATSCGMAQRLQWSVHESDDTARGALSWDLVDRLHKALRVGNITVAQMAAELGVHRNTVGNYLRGTTPPDRRTLITWALACGVPFTWLAGTQQTPPSPDGPGGESVRREGIEPPTR